MNTLYPETKQILEALHDIVELRHVNITTENTDWRGRPYRSDYVMIEPEHKIGFEVFHNEIIVFYFGDHCHFEDYTSDLTEGMLPYPQRAIDFLRRFFTTPLQLLEKRKWNHILRSEWFFLLPDGRKESLAGPWFHKLFTNPFARSWIEVTNWYYNKFTGSFLETEDDMTVVHVIEVSADLLLEISRKNNVYSYSILRHVFDEDDLFWYWSPASSGGIHLFDTEEKATKAGLLDAKSLKFPFN